jgi:glycine cleavage system transcriptional repressor
MPYFVLSAIGRDRSGIVDQITGYLRRHGANIEESRMATLGGEFAVMLLFSAEGAPGDLDKFAGEAGLTALVRPTTSPSERPQEPSMPLRIEVVATDRPGIAHEVSHLLHDLGVNIVEVTTQLTDAPHTGVPLFEMVLEVAVPAPVKVSSVREALERLADRLNLDLSVSKPGR